MLEGIQNQVLTMISRITLFVSFLFFVSCSKSPDFPNFVSEKVKLEEVKLMTQLSLFDKEKKDNPEIPGLSELQGFKNLYLSKNPEFSLNDFSVSWSETGKQFKTQNLQLSDLGKWFDITAFLYQLSGDAVYAEELNNIVLQGVGESPDENRKIVSPYIFTKNFDNLFVNIFTPANINYEHTTKGNVDVTMETNFPESGNVNLTFGMTKRRYIEVSIRIPSWAEGTTVTVKKVKYVAPAGIYCKIAKKWKEGDLIEVKFPIENRPK